MYRARANQPPRRLSRKRLLLFCAAAIAATIVIAGALEATNVTNLMGSTASDKYTTQPSSPGRTINESTKGETEQTNTDKDNPEYHDDKAEQTITDNNTDLTAPSGSFVSNHRPNLGGSPAPNELQSTCTTTPGATCKILFKKAGTTKELPAQQTDRGGSSYWTWKLQDIGLTEGDWEVSAIATLGGQTKAAKDSLKLEVRP